VVSLCLTSTSRWSRRRPPCSAAPRRCTRCHRRGGSPRGLAVHGTARNRLRASVFACWLAPPGLIAAHAGRRLPASAPAPSWPEQCPGQGPRVQPVQDNPDRLPSGARYRPATGSHGARSRARSAWLARLVHCPTAVSRSFPAVGKSADRDSRSGRPAGRSALAGKRGSGSASSRCQAPEPDHLHPARTRPRARQRATMPLRARHTSSRRPQRPT